MATGGLGLAACRRGASAVETALVLTIFLGVLFVIVNVSMVLWTRVSLNFAVQAAARCASVSSPYCLTKSAIEAYALDRYKGTALGQSRFNYSDAGAESGCRHNVAIDHTYTMTMPFHPRGAIEIPLAATACFP